MDGLREAEGSTIRKYGKPGRGERFLCEDDNIALIRGRYPEGLNFVVGDVHGEVATLQALMEHIRFDPGRDHIWFVGDYNAGGNVRQLFGYMARYYRPDPMLPGFHMIRGNHERELWPMYALENLPDLYIIKKKCMTYWVAHAGMIRKIFDAVRQDMAGETRQVAAYRFDDATVGAEGVFRQVVWSRNGLYSQEGNWYVWPPHSELVRNHALIIHGHTPFSFLKHGDYFSYGSKCLFWEKQHILFSEGLQSFDIDADAKGRCENGETYRGIACLCLEAVEEIAEKCGGCLTREGIRQGENIAFGAERTESMAPMETADVGRILYAQPAMKTITSDVNGDPVIIDAIIH